MRSRLLSLAILACAVPLAAHAQEPQGAVMGAGSTYRLSPGDILEVRVWGHEEFSGRFQVNENWEIQYPGVGDLEVRSQTIAEVRDRIRAELENIFVNPFVTVTPLFRMAVLGHVRNPGLYTVDPTLSVLDAVALAGGPTSQGNIGKIRVLRTGAEAEFDFERETLSGRTLAEIGVRSGDEIIVPRKWFTREDWVLVVGIVQVFLSIAIFVSVN